MMDSHSERADGTNGVQWLLSRGFSTVECIRLLEQRRRYERGAIRYTLPERRLRFARWLVQSGRLAEAVPDHRAAAPVTLGPSVTTPPCRSAVTLSTLSPNDLARLPERPNSSGSATGAVRPAHTSAGTALPTHTSPMPRGGPRARCPGHHRALAVCLLTLGLIALTLLALLMAASASMM
jgi:hypothetical protein